ncbi:50S ribosomal protein L17 [Iocasia frigidifontis]|uniref:Large ribosomal subunit protein bL17 n=1 Tax=Iocasia fonsfrigidae TaxID=2682810 RepID=A0A8A7KN49_9FIRM|nr:MULTISPECIES: 50S ribosomal protein L17 [Halanaerobiaceae]AZO96517.1 50S ribosomal protein L17 [Halocella sp. SP3-1]MTI60550.1 50S ribosomal protein L17 [Bacillota bacterium]QTL99272.1 50S ribosomal protein L17 [Iocasia fonsfrigidae]
MPQRKLGKTTPHRKAMFNNLLTDFFRHERLETTLPKAKELRPMAEKMITTAQKNDLSSRRKVLKRIKDKEIVQRLFDEIAPRFSDRPGGYTRILKMYPRRGDASEKAIIELVE